MSELEDLKQYYKEEKESKLEQIKEKLKPLAQDLKAFTEERQRLSHQVDELGRKISDLEKKIRAIWLPYIEGAEIASIDLDGVILKTSPILAVKAEDKDATMDWMATHGYKDVMKWQIHHQTMCKIAREEYEKEDRVEIPGLTYEYIQKIKVN